MFLFQGDEKDNKQASVDENIRKGKEDKHEDTTHTHKKDESSTNREYQLKTSIEDEHTIEVQMTQNEAVKEIMNDNGKVNKGDNSTNVETRVSGSKSGHTTNMEPSTESSTIGNANLPTLSEAVLSMFVETGKQRSQSNEVQNYSRDLIVADSLHNSDKPTAIVKPCKKIYIEDVKREGKITSNDDSIIELLGNSNTNYITINKQEIESKEDDKINVSNKTKEDIIKLDNKIKSIDRERKSTIEETKTIEENNKQMMMIVEEFEKTINQLVVEKEREEVCQQIVMERLDKWNNKLLCNLFFIPGSLMKEMT